MNIFKMIARQRELAGLCSRAGDIDPEKARSLPIHVEKLGDTGPRVIFIHGGVQGAIGGGPRSFDLQRGLSALGWRLEFVDRPGFGASPSRGVDDLDATGAWIAELLGEGAHLVGHSWGGAASLLAAAERPAAVRSLTLIEPALQGLAATDPSLQSQPETLEIVFGLMQRWLEGAETPAAYASNFLGSLGRPGAALSEGGSLDNEALERLGCALLNSKMSSPMTLRAAANAVSAAKIPVLVVSGDWGPWFQAVGEIVASTLSGQHKVIASPNHFPQLENPEVFNGLLDGFMRGCVPPDDRTLSEGGEHEAK